MTILCEAQTYLGGKIKYNPGIIAWCCFQDPQQPQRKVEFYWQHYKFIPLATLNTILCGSAGQKPFFFLHLEINSPAQHDSWLHPNRLKWTLMCPKKKKDFQVNKYISQRHINKVTQTRNDKQQGGVWSQTVRTTKDWYEIALSWKLFAHLWWWWWWWCCYCIQINASLGGGVKSRKLTLVFILTCCNSVTFDDDDDDVKPRRVWRKNLLMSNPPLVPPSKGLAGLERQQWFHRTQIGWNDGF